MPDGTRGTTEKSVACDSARGLDLVSGVARQNIPHLDGSAPGCRKCLTNACVRSRSFCTSSTKRLNVVTGHSRVYCWLFSSTDLEFRVTHTYNCRMHNSTVHRYTDLGVTEPNVHPEGLSLACKFGTRNRGNLASCPIARHRSSNFVHAMPSTSPIHVLFYHVETRPA